MRIPSPGLIGLLIALAISPRHVACREITDLYRAETVVTGTEEPERTRGFREALGRVVVKLTGDIRLATDPRILGLAAKPHDLVATFEYEDRMKDIPVHDEQGTRERPHFLRVAFAKPAIDAALQRLGIAKWPADRPVVAVWLRIDTLAGRILLTPSGPEGYGQRAVITETARRLGLPIVLPGAGSTIGFDDIVADRIATLRTAAPTADAHLVGRLTVRDDGYWDMTWSFLTPPAVHHWSLSRVTFDEALTFGLAKAVGTLSGAAGK
ncbi:MAG: DUF2066 domain-containing protein [Hyphomicrobiaceae bacterium]